MHGDSEVLQRKLLKLLQDLIPNASIADAAAISQQFNEVERGNAGNNSADRSTASSHSTFSQDASSITSGHHESETVSPQGESLFKLGELPAVQDRFYSLLKNRLQTEIQRNPPLFPWETEIHDYETESVQTGVAAPVGAQIKPVWVWSSQLKNLSLPVPMPEKVLAQLLERCQDVVQSSLLEGAKLVRAVEELFPGQSQALNQLAGLVMTAPARSGATTTPAAGTNYPPNYEAAVPPQQMVLSLLAAKEIITSLTLPLSVSQPRVERQWLSEEGALTLNAEYEPTSASAKLRIRGTLPCGGSLIFRGNGLQASAERVTAGHLNVELDDVQPNQPYALEVRLTEKDPNPLIFAVRVVQE